MAKPDMSRNEELAGQTVTQGKYEVTYDKNGYAQSAINTEHQLFSDPEYDGTYEPGTNWGTNQLNKYSGDYSGNSFGSGSSSGSRGSYSPGDYTEYLKDLYAQNTAAQLAGLKSAYDQNVDDLKAAAEKIPETY